MRYRFISLFLCIGLLFSGCAPENGGQKSEDKEVLSMNTTPDLSYVVPSTVPHILVDQVGYTIDGKKTAIFRGTDLPDEFEVVDALSGEVVFSGEIKEKQRENTAGDLIGYGDFSELTDEGTYFIRGSVFGRSYDFDIAEDVYDDIFNSSVEKLSHTQVKKINVLLPENQTEQPEIIMQGGWITDEAGNQDMKLAAEVVITGLAAFELYPSSFVSADAQAIPQILQYLKSQTEWMRLLQDEKSGGVYGGIEADNTKTITAYSMREIDGEATAAYAAAMAKFSYVYKKYDQQYAAQCLKAADRAWKYINKLQLSGGTEANVIPQDIIFCAATELYRSSGWNTYHLSAKKIMETGFDVTGSIWSTYGTVTYLNTRHSVDKKYCETLMKQLMGRAEEISAASRASAYLTEGNDDFSNTKDLLWNMVILSIADYVITNHEYATVIENHQHYFFGCNRSALCLVQEDGCDNINEAAGIQDDLQLNGYHIFMLSQILNEE